MKRDIYGEMVELLKSGRQRKEALCAYFGLDERSVRCIIHSIALEYPVIALSDEPGYRIATGPEHAQRVKQQIKEHDKRAKEIVARESPLYEFLYENGEREHE